MAIVIIDRYGEVIEETPGILEEDEGSEIDHILDETRLHIIPVDRENNRDAIPGRDFDPDRYPTNRQ